MMSGDQRRAAALGLTEPRLLPHSIEIEQAVLGTLLMHNASWAKISDVLDRDCFYEDLHKRLYDVIATILTEGGGRSANPITIKTHLPDQDLGGTTLGQYLARLAAEASLPSEIRGYALILHDLKLKRAVIGAAMDALDMAYAGPVAAKTVVEGLMDRLNGFDLNPGEARGFQRFGAIVHRALGKVQDMWRGTTSNGLSTGFPRLDEALGMLQPSDLVILAGRPGSGKTGLATNIAFNVARDLDARQKAGERTGVVAFFSLEMSAQQLSLRIIAQESGVPHFVVRRNKATQQQIERMMVAGLDLKNLPLHIDASGGLTMSLLAARARDLAKRRGIALLVVDYLQLIGGKGGKDEKRFEVVSDVSMRLKALAKELDVPLIALSQVSRNVDFREDKRPQLADLRESGNIEQDADVVMFLYREEYYLKKQKPPEDGSDARLTYERRLAMVEGVAEVAIAKNRHGPDALLEMGFDSPTIRFLDVPPPRNDAYEPIPRQKAKQDSLPTKAAAALKILQDLTVAHAVVGRELERVPRWVTRPVSYLLWKERCAEQLLDVTCDDKAKAMFMTSVCLTLKEHEMIGRGGTPEDPYAWLTEKGRQFHGKASRPAGASGPGEGDDAAQPALV